MGRRVRSELARITAVLLDPSASAVAVADAASDLYECLRAPAGALPAAEDTVLDQGLALHPASAADCTKDPLRTAVLLRAVEAALRDALARFPGQTIEIVYAGTGPLAPLAIPLLPRFEDAPLAFTFIDIHAHAIDAARAVAGYFGVTPLVRDFVVADATRYEHPRPLHMVVTETMQRALRREPQVAITRQLARQLVPGGILVPERIRVDLIAGTAEHRLLDVRASVAHVPLDDRGCLPPVRVTIPPHDRAAYRTTVMAYRDHVIGQYESGLTHPELAWLPEHAELEFRYQLGAEPGLVWQPYSAGTCSPCTTAAP
jgi:SAM-dependent methyltransferase